VYVNVQCTGQKKKKGCRSQACTGTSITCLKGVGGNLFSTPVPQQKVFLLSLIMLELSSHVQNNRTLPLWGGHLSAFSQLSTFLTEYDTFVLLKNHGFRAEAWFACLANANGASNELDV
jgi:hypothetical protein